MAFVTQVGKFHGRGSGSKLSRFSKFAKFPPGNRRYGGEYDAGNFDYVPKRKIKSASLLGDYDRKSAKKSGGPHVKGGGGGAKSKSGSIPGGKQGE